ncbi:MAG: hypothetical protein LBB18_03425 [Puniceicoccales bacterium]|nr:hypothetical protein [Puniceicoccales bacterium]
MAAKDTVDLYDVLPLIESREDAIAFIGDLCTPREVAELSLRWKICQLLRMERSSYSEIRAKIGASFSAIARVSKVLSRAADGGYVRILKKLHPKEKKNEKNGKSYAFLRRHLLRRS